MRRTQEEQFGNRVIASDLTNPDFVRYAQSFGAEAEGIALWSCPGGSGYWVAVDQLMPLKTRVSGYVDFGFFLVQGDGRGIRRDADRGQARVGHPAHRGAADDGGQPDDPLGGERLAAGVGDLPGVLERAAHHKGSAFVEIYQDCNVFNHFAFEYYTLNIIQVFLVTRILLQSFKVNLQHGSNLLAFIQRQQVNQRATARRA